MEAPGLMEFLFTLMPGEDGEGSPAAREYHISRSDVKIFRRQMLSTTGEPALEDSYAVPSSKNSRQNGLKSSYK
jgi:hypothetical protein